MKKGTLKALLLAGLVKSLSVNAQSAGSSGHIDYAFHHQYDSLDAGGANREIMRLYFNEPLAVYKSLQRMQFDSAIRSQLKKAEQSGNTFNLNFGHLPAGSIDQFYVNTAENTVKVFRRFLNVNYVVEDTARPVWTLAPETRQLLGYACQKATTFFKGRRYAAWFTYELPLPIGPWKLRGLPGAILLAEDARRQVRFEATAVAFGPVPPLTLPEPYERTTAAKLAAAVQARRETGGPPTGDGLIQVQAASTRPQNRLVRAINNPVELAN